MQDTTQSVISHSTIQIGNKDLLVIYEEQDSKYVKTYKILETLIY